MTKEKPFKKIIDAITGEETIVDLTTEEIAEMAALEAANQQQLTEAIAAKEAKDSATASAVAKLTAIGLTAEEIAALRG